jgi:hypothetical protein
LIHPPIFSIAAFALEGLVMTLYLKFGRYNGAEKNTVPVVFAAILSLSLWVSASHGIQDFSGG